MVHARTPSRAESLVQIWGRRLVSIQLYALLGAILLVGLPVWFVLLSLVDLVTDRRWPRVRTLLAFTLYFACELSGLTAAFLLWVVLVGGLTGRARFVDANATLQRMFTNTLMRGMVAIYRLEVDLDGADQIMPAPFLLFVRHVSTVDTLLAAAFVANPHRVLLKYVLKRELLWDPCLDVVGRRLPNAFVDRSGSRRDAEIRAVAGLGQGLDVRTAVLVYPEGTRFRPSALEKAVVRLAKEGDPALLARAKSYRHVLPPRLGGPLALLDAAPGVDVLVLEHVGLEGARTLGNLWRGDLIGRTLRIRLRRLPAASIPSTDRATWLFDRWAETDAWVSAHSARKDPETSP